MKPITADKEPCKELYDMGVRIDSYCYWINYPREKGKWWLCDYMGLMNETYHDSIPAPQLQELLDVIPNGWKLGNNACCWTLKHPMPELPEELREYDFRYDTQDGILVVSEQAPNPANAVIKTLIWLIKNNRVEVKDGKIQKI